MIPVVCGCGQTIPAKDEHAGRRIRCRACGAVLTVPHPDDPRTVFEIDADPSPPIRSGWRFPDFSVVRVLLLLIAILAGFPATLGLFAALRGLADPSSGWQSTCLIFTVALAGLAASRPRR